MTGVHPRLRSHQRKRKSGRVVVYYVYDMRHEGKPDIPLGTDFDEAVKKWDEIHNRAPRIVGTLEEAFAAWEEKALPLYTNKYTLEGYTRSLRMMRPVFGPATWDQVDLPALKAYLNARTAKTQGNREIALLSVIWNWARGEGIHQAQWPAAGMERSRWKNKEKARKVRVSDDLFDAVYAEAPQLLRDCMDLATATGMRLTDCINVLLPRGDTLTLEANKTGKEAEFDVSLSAVLPGLLKRRRAIKADHLMLLSTDDGKPVNLSMLRYRWNAARSAAAAKAKAAGNDDLAKRIKGLILRDMRKRAAQLSDNATKLLQHDNEAFTRKHYDQVAQLKPAR